MLLICIQLQLIYIHTVSSNLYKRTTNRCVPFILLGTTVRFHPRIIKLYDKCTNCDVNLLEDAKFCIECGTPCVKSGNTLAKFVNDIYLPHRQNDVSPNTYRVESGFWKLINKKLGHLPMEQIDVKTWENYLYQMKRRNCSPRTQLLHQMTFLNALKYAHYCGYIESVLNLRKIKGSTTRRRQIIPFTANEVRRLLLNADKKHRAMFALGIGMGLRPNELLSIMWSDIDFEKKMLYVRGSKTKQSSVSIPFTDLAYRETLKWWKTNRQPKTGYLFRAPKNPRSRMGKYRSNEVTFKSALVGTAKRAHVDITSDGTERRIFPYLLRHSFATLAATSNPPVPIPVTQAIMRHTSSRMILEIYAKAGALSIQEGLQNFVI